MKAPSVLKGFRDHLPEAARVREELIYNFTEVFKNLGFEPTSTPSIEYYELLAQDSDTDVGKQVYKFEDHGGREVGLRFDMTVPLGRFIQNNFQQLSLPLKRFQVGNVWRGEAPKKGRYREFCQCDIDIIGADSPLADALILKAIATALNSCEIKFRFSLNSRKILESFFQSLNLDSNCYNHVLRSLDKLSKVGTEGVLKELGSKSETKNIDQDTALKIMSFCNTKTNSIEECQSVLNSFGVDAIAAQELFTALKIAALEENQFVIDFSIARGLDYYTGIVFETFCEGGQDFGSISSGGRYNNLIISPRKESIPAVGASIGVDRLLSLIEDQKNSSDWRKNRLLICFQQEDQVHLSKIWLNSVLSGSLELDIYPTTAKLQKQLKYANKTKTPWVVFLSDTTEKENLIHEKDILWNLKNLDSGDQNNDLTIDQITQIIKDAR